MNNKELDTISRQAAIDIAKDLLIQMEEYHQYNQAVNNYCAELVKLPSAQPDLSEYSNKLWRNAYERGKAEAQQRWIPVSEMLPEPRTAVLGYAPKYNNIYALYYDSVMGWMIWSPIRDDIFPNSQGEIIAWMPLPEPYQEEGEK